MNKIEEFQEFLCSDFASRTGEPYSSRVASDFASRLRSLDRLFGQPINDRRLLNERSYEAVEEDIKREFLARKSAKSKTRYPYSPYIMALKRYCQFIKNNSH